MVSSVFRLKILNATEPYYDVGTGQFYNHNRFYNPELGRYMEPDPIGLEGGLNPYAYAGNNPVMNSDPSGLDITTGFGGLLTETYNWALGNGFDWQNLKGAFRDGYNGEGSFSNPYANMAWSTGNDLLNFATLGLGGVAKNSVTLGARQLDNVVNSTKFAKPKMEIRSVDFVGPPKIYGPPKMFGPYHRLGTSTEDMNNIIKTGELRGNPPTNFYRSDIPKVQSYLGELPSGKSGFEFYTPIKPNGGGLDGSAIWSPDARVINRNGQAIISCVITKRSGC